MPMKNIEYKKNHVNVPKIKKVDFLNQPFLNIYKKRRNRQ